MASPDMLAGRQLGRLPIDHDVRETGFTGGGGAAHRRLADFIRDGLARYADEHNHPDANATSRLSPWLHFGHLGAHEVFEAVMKHEAWSMRKLPDRSRGAREGWWGVSATAEAFLDELVTWRELAFNTSAFLPGFTTVESLPSWARATLDAHRADPRPHLYDADTLDRAATHDRLWNAAQRQLVRDGWFHGYLRMLWGKKIFEWSPSPEAALATMERLMNRYSLDGRDPNSWAGFGWVLGRYDRPWPEREIFGKLRYMSSSNTLKKLRLKRFLSEYSTEPSAGPSPAARR
jgi:deoxyribodipyrimidine photo-lyase